MRSEKDSADAFSLRSIISLLTLVLFIGILIWLSFNVNIPEPEVLKEMIQAMAGLAGWFLSALQP